MDGMMVVAICGCAVVCAGVSMKIAAGRGRNPLLWGAVGLVFNLPGLAVTLFLPKRVHKPRIEACSDASITGHGPRAAVA